VFVLCACVLVLCACVKGYPIYGPNGYIEPFNPASGVTRLESGYTVGTPRGLVSFSHPRPHPAPAPPPLRPLASPVGSAA
jgi:hypothetical protein